VDGVFSTVRAEFAELKTFGVFFAFHHGVVSAQAFRANQKNLFPTHLLFTFSVEIIGA
jgi:hypothetical protein